MDDLIRRLAAIDAVLKRDANCGIDAAEVLETLPPAQSEIVHCKDCKYNDENWRRVAVRWLPCMDIKTGSKWFCGSAERQEVDE